MSAERPSTPSTPSGGGGKLESLSREDLIKFAKRQTLLFNKAKAKIDELSKKTDGSGEIQIVLQQKDELEGQLNLTRQEKDRLAQENEEVQQSRDVLQSQNDKIQLSKEKLQKEKDNICKELEEIKVKLEEINEKYEEADEERLSAVEAYQLLQKTLEQATMDKTTQASRVQELEEKVGQLTNQIVALREENECLKMQHTSTLESVKAIQTEYQKLSEDHRSLDEQHQATCAELEDASTKKDKLIVNFKVLKQKYLEMKKGMDGSRAESPMAAETSPREDDSDEKQLKEQLASVQKELANQKREFDEQTKEFTQMKVDLEEKSQVLDGLDSENSELKLSLSQLQEEYDSFRAQQEKSDQQLLQGQMSTSAIADVRAECEARITEWKERVELMRAEYEETTHKQQAEIAKLNEALQEATAVNDQSKERVEELVLGLGKESAGIISQYEDKMAVYEKEKTQLLAQIRELSEQTASQDDGAEQTDNEISPNIPSDEKVTDTASTNESTSVSSSALSEAVVGAAVKVEAAADLKDVQESKTDMELECQSLRDTVLKLNNTVTELRLENESWKKSHRVVEKIKSNAATSSDSSGPSSDVIQLFEHIRLQGIDLTDKDKQIEELGRKVSELVNYSSKLKTKCKLLLEANDQLTTTVEQQERRLVNDARGARNLELHFQETENNVNEQIAHFHEERDQMIARVQEYAADIDRLRSEMLPFKDQEKQCVRILFNGVQLLADQDPDEYKDLPLSNLEGLAKLLVSSALRFKAQCMVMARDHDNMQKSDIFMKKVTLNWRNRYEEQAWLNRNLKKSIAYLEKKIEELEGDKGNPEEVHTERKAIQCLQNLEYMSVEELEAEAMRVNEQEITRLYKEGVKREKEVQQLRVDNDDLEIKVARLNRRVNTYESSADTVEPDDQVEESSSSTSEVDVRPKIRTPKVKPQSQLVTTSAQTEETGTDLEDKAIQGLRETIASLRTELKNTSDVSDELAALKISRSEEGDRVEELTKQLAEANTSIEEKDVEIEYLLEVIQRHKARIEQQKKSLEELDIQLNKNSIQEKFQVQVGDSQQSKLQASLSAAFVDLQKSNEERDALRVELEKLQGKAVVVDHQTEQPSADAPTDVDEKVEQQSLPNSENAELKKEFEELKNHHEKLVTELRDSKEMLTQKEKEIEEMSEKLTNVNTSRDEVITQKEGLLLQLNKLLDQIEEERKAFDENKVELLQKLSSSEEETKLISAKVTELQNESEDEKVQHAQLLAKYEELEQSKNELAKHLDDTRHEVEQSVGNVADIQKNFEELEAQRDQLISESMQLEEEKKGYQQNLSSVQNESENLLAKIVEIQKERDEIKSQHDELLDEKLVLSEKHHEEQNKYSAEIDQYKTDKAQYITTVEGLEEVVRQLEEEKCLLNENFKNSEDKTSSLQSQVQQLEEKYTLTTQQMADEMSARKSLQEENDVSKKEIDQLHRQNDELNSELDNLKYDNEKLQAVMHDLNTVAESGKDDLEKKYSNITENLRKEVKELTETLKEKDKTIHDMSEKLSFHKVENETLQKQVLALTEGNDAEVLRLKEMLDASQLETERLEAAVESTHSELQVLNGSLEEERAQHKHSVDELLDKLKNVSATLETCKEKEEANVALMEGQQAEIAKLSNQLVDVQKELEQARKEVMETSSSSLASTMSEQEMASNDAKVKELEDRANKFKLFALKAKKELAECKATIEKLNVEKKEGSSNKVGEMQTLMANYQHLQQDFDRLQDDLDTERSNVTALKSQLEGEQTASTQLQGRVTELLGERENNVQSISQLQSKVKELESLQIEQNSTVSSLEKESDSRQMEVNDLSKTVSRMTEQMKTAEANSRLLEDKLRSKINELELKVHEARDELEQANKTMSKSNVMDLEIADFERTVSTLEAEVREKVETITSLQQEIRHEQQKCTSLEQQLVTADEQRESVENRFDKLQQTLNKTKAELDEAKQQASETKNTDLAVRGELEVLRQQYEDCKIELSKMSAQRHTTEDKLKSSHDAHQRMVRTLENRNRSLQSDLESSRRETTMVQEDYDNYKVRVHSVLKQQQTRASVEAALESEKVEKEHMQEVLSQVKVKLQETSDKLQAALSESGLLQDELDKLSLKYNKLTQDMSHKESVHRQRVDQLMLENSTISAEHSSSLAQMGQHNEIMSQTFKEQMKTSQTEHEHQVSILNSRIGRLESEKSSLALELQTVRQQQGNNKPEQVKPLRQHSRQSVLLSATSSDVRESGEGMEHPNPSQGSHASQPQVGAANTLVGLEQLLTSAEDDSVSVVSVSSTAQASDSGGDEAKVKSRLHLAEKQLEHLRELLNDSEATCLRYNEQVKLLKQEIRRLESNQQRENSISNMEYLKNIVYKFTTLESGDERGRLLPVLNTMLKFTDEELSTLKKIALSDTEAETADGQAQGSWSGYLHRWTGFSS